MSALTPTRCLLGKISTLMKVLVSAFAIMAISRLESRDQLFWQCQFRKSCWSYINVDLNENLVVANMLSSAKSNFNKPFFMEGFATATWAIWKARNARICDNVIT
jgi:hypothetical protein